MNFHRLLLVSVSLLAFACGSGPTSEEESDEGALEQGSSTPAPSSPAPSASVPPAASTPAPSASVPTPPPPAAIRPGEYGGVEAGNALHAVSVYAAGKAILSVITANGNILTIAEGLPTEALIGPEGDTCPGYKLTQVNDTTLEVGLADGSARASCDIEALGKYVAGH